MFEQMVKDMHVPPDVLAQLSDEQKDVLHYEIRQLSPRKPEVVALFCANNVVMGVKVSFNDRFVMKSEPKNGLMEIEEVVRDTESKVSSVPYMKFDADKWIVELKHSL
ncbi:hypothetical protein CLF_100845 [Clonorchis sinensis]|uniref:Uncharacterized protein n=1 Tax=Clonorchis sinensis TaxID=79923 RepID=G7Y4D8_CLOSI|nr:hypothetical protein CLF_100845 [Clonorchis sinensis]